MKRVDPRDGRILPGACAGGTYLGDLGNPVLPDAQSGTGNGIQVLSSKWATIPATSAKGRIKKTSVAHGLG